MEVGEKMLAPGFERQILQNWKTINVSSSWDTWACFVAGRINKVTA